MTTDSDDFHTRARSKAELEREALALRMAAGSANEMAPDLVDDIRNLDSSGALSGLRLIARADSEMGTAEGRCFVESRVIELRQSVMDSLAASNPRSRMTLAHELAHAALNHVGVPSTPKNRTQGGNKAAYNIPTPNSAEWQARYFASAYLMLRAHVLECKSPEEVAQRCTVSLAAARIRYDEVHGTGQRKTPQDIALAIQKLRAGNKNSAQEDDDLKHVRPDVQAKLLWSLAPELDGHPPAEYRVIDTRYVIRKSRHNHSIPGGWRLVDGCIVPWEQECSM